MMDEQIVSFCVLLITASNIHNLHSPINHVNFAVNVVRHLSLFRAIVVLIAVSFSKLDANEVGLNYSYNSKTIENKIYSSGTKFLGLGHGFIDFPTV
jgi:hypothetical protein